MSLDSLSRQQISTPLQPQQSPVQGDPSSTVSTPSTSPIGTTSPAAPDLGGGIMASLFAGPDVVAHAPTAVTAKAVDATTEKAILHQAGRQIAGGVQGIRDLAAQAAPSPSEALKQVSACYVNASDTASLNEIDVEVPSLFSKALMQSSIGQGSASDVKALEDTCKEKLTMLFEATDSVKVEDAKEFFSGLYGLLDIKSAEDKEAAPLLRVINNLASNKLEDLQDGAMNSLEDIAGSAVLAEAQDKVKQAEDNLFDAKIALIETENSPTKTTAELSREDKIASLQENVERMESQLASAKRELTDVQAQCVTFFAGRSECRMESEVKNILGDNFAKLRDGEYAMSLDEMMQAATESPLLTNDMRTSITDDLAAFSQETLEGMPEALATAVEDLHVQTGADGKVLMGSGNLDAREASLRSDILDTTLAGHGREEALEQLQTVMTNLRAERSEALQEIFSGTGELHLNESQCQTLTTLLHSEEVAYNPRVVEQIRAFGDGLAAQVDIIGQAMAHGASMEQKRAGAHSLDMMLMDNPLMADQCLAMKEMLFDGVELSASDRDSLMANHKAVCAKSSAFAALGGNATFEAALSQADKAQGCDKHHVADLSMRKLMENGLGADSKTKAESVMLYHAASAEYEASIAGKDMTPDELDESYADFMLSLPTKLQETLAQAFDDISKIDGACTAGITNEKDYDTAVQSLAKATKHFNGKRARNALHANSGVLVRAQVGLAKDRLMDSILAHMSTSAEMASTDELAGKELAAIREHVKDSGFGTTIRTGEPRYVSSQYIDAVAGMMVQQHDASHNEIIQGVMRAQGVTSLRDVKGDSMAVALQYVSRILTTSAHDLTEADLARVGLTHSDLGDKFALSYAIEHMDWGNVDNGFAVGTVLHQLYATDCHDKGNVISHVGDFVAFAESLGVPPSFDSELRQAYATLTASPSERQEALKNLALHPSNTHSVGNLHVDFATMTTTKSAHFSTKPHEKDSLEQADSRSFTRLLAAYTDHSGSASGLQDISDQLQSIIGQYRPQMDAVLMLQDRGKDSVADTMQRIDKEVFTKKAAASDLHAAARGSVRTEALGVIGTGHNLQAMSEKVAKDNGKDQNRFVSKIDKEHRGAKAVFAKLASPISQRIHARALTHPSKDDSVNMALLQTSLLSAFEASGAKSFGAFGQMYNAQLNEAHGAISQTAICKDMAAQLQEFGMDSETATARAHDLLVGYKTSLPRLVQSTIKQVHAHKLEQSLQKSAELRGDPTTMESVRHNMCAESTNRILDELGTGDAVYINSARKVVAKIGVDTGSMATASVDLAKELSNNIMISRDDGGRPCVTMTAESIRSIAASAGAAGFFAKATASYEHAQGLRMAFKNESDCSNFVASIFSGGASEDDLAYLDEVSFLNERAVGVGVFMKEDIISTANVALAAVGKEMSKPRLEATASAHGSVGVSHERHRHGETTRIQSSYQVGASFMAGVGGRLKMEMKAKRSFENAFANPTMARSAGKNKAVHGYRANVQYGVENTLELNYADSNGKILNGEDQRILTSARREISSKFMPADNVSQLAADFMERHNVPKSEQKHVETWLAQNANGPFTLAINYDAKASAIEHLNADDAKKALNNKNNFTFGNVTITTDKMVFSSHKQIPIPKTPVMVSADVQSHRTKSVSFGNEGRRG